MIHNKEVAKWWNGIVQDTRFDLVTIYARSACMDGQMNPDMLNGANRFEQVLRTVAIDEVGIEPIPSPGLRHDLDNPKPKAMEPLREKFPAPAKTKKPKSKR